MFPCGKDAERARFLDLMFTEAETYYGDVIPAETTTATASKFSAFVNAQRRASHLHER